MQEALARIGAELDTETGPDSVVLSLSLLDRFVPRVSESCPTSSSGRGWARPTSSASARCASTASGS